MINHEDQLKLQAYLDGELSESDARGVADRLAGDQEAAALVTELRQTHAALAEAEAGVTLPESRQFYWSKIERQIRATQPSSRLQPMPETLASRLRRLLVPLTGLGLVGVAVLVAIRSEPQSNVGVETSLADSGAMIYHDYSAGATFVWLSYPAEKEVPDYDEMDPFE
ncbi:MAG TPA: hypothetical protein VHI52_12300 [Verrucomicrobiae bacterium]|nr:hypothetical protein [Verrucomicrobiae bacterium]